MRTSRKHIVAIANQAEAPSAAAEGSFMGHDAGLSSRSFLRLARRHQVVGRPGAKSSGVAGFTLVDALLASGILVIFVAACLSAIFVNQIVTRKVKEQAIAMDFLTKYVENIKALPFQSAVPGQPINVLYNINIPANTNWVALDTTNFLVFYPDLVWLANRNPKLSVSTRQTTVSGAVHDREFNLKFNWDPPVKKGGQLEVQVDFLRTANVPTL